MPSPTSSICWGCGGSKRRDHYLCPGCWPQLPQAARTALKRTDAAAFRRLAALVEQLRNDVPLGEVVITDEH